MAGSGFQRIVILGAGGHAREQLSLIEAINDVAERYTVEGFAVDSVYAKPGDVVRGLPVLCEIDRLESLGGDVAVVCGIGGSADRARIVERVKGIGVRFETLVHPTAALSDSVSLGEGAIVGARSVLTSDIEVGDHVHLGVGSVVSHDCTVGDYVSLGPGCLVAGVVRIAEGAQLGVGTVVSDRVAVGAWSIAGAGAVIVDDVPADSTVVGVPARVVANREAGWQRADASRRPSRLSGGT